MSEASDLKISMLCLKWRVHARNNTSDYTNSSEFKFQGTEWQWRLALRFTGKYRLYLHMSRHDEPFGVEVDVENGASQILPGLKTKGRYSGGNGSVPLIWEKSEDDIVRAYPEFYRNSQVLHFRVLLTDADLVKETDSVANQTECILSVDKLPCLESLSGDLAQLMDRDSDPDVEFQCGDESTMAHRLIICSRSPVLATMLSTDMVEGRTGVVKIPNMDPKVFRHLLKYIYAGTLDELTFSVALSLYEAGDQYAVRGLAKRCSRFLLEHLDAENVCDVLLVAVAHSDDVFKEAVIRFMVDNKVPQVQTCWPEFCRGHPQLAIEVLNRLCNAVTK